jgi:hypothetical protein
MRSYNSTIYKYIFCEFIRQDWGFCVHLKEVCKSCADWKANALSLFIKLLVRRCKQRQVASEPWSHSASLILSSHSNQGLFSLAVQLGRSHYTFTSSRLRSRCWFYATLLGNGKLSIRRFTHTHTHGKPTGLIEIPFAASLQASARLRPQIRQRSHIPTSFQIYHSPTILSFGVI